MVKKLMCAAVIAASMLGMAAETALPAAAVPTEAKAVKAGANRPRMSKEQFAKMREQREKYMAERKARMAAKMLEVVKKYVPEEEQAKALVNELQEAMAVSRRATAMRRSRPNAVKPAEAK